MTIAAEPDQDPRAAAGPGERDILPIVERPRLGLSTGAIVAIGVTIGLLLFVALISRRQSALEPVTAAPTVETAGTTVPTLYIPPEPAAEYVPAPLVPITPARAQQIVPAPRSAAPVAQVTQSTPMYYPPLQSLYAAAPSPPARTSSGAALVLDTSSNADAPARSNGSAPATGAPGNNDTLARARAGMLANRSTTVPQGTLIAAVLETGFDSTRPGFARALVQRDIRGFDGSQVLIPRGSRLIGEYAADAQRGQNRAMVNWTRLIRPDGVTIALDSPATDTVGRGGVKAHVNSHFFERFAGAILQSSLDLGINLAARSSGSTVILTPGSVQLPASITSRTNDVRPTLTVAPGTSISVFVARDLDFAGVGRDE